MKVFIAALFTLLCVVPCLAAQEEKDTPKNGDEIYEQAEKLEWYLDNNMKEVDALYDKAIKAGSDKAFMATSNNRLFMADRDSEAQKKLIEELCPRMETVAKKFEKGRDPDQLFHVARYYSMPWCEKRDLKKTREYLTTSAEAGNIKAQYYMGRMLSKKDPAAAFGWYKKAAEVGFPQAIAQEGSCYLLGNGVEKNTKKGMELINKALASKNPNTMYDIAIWYLDGKGGLGKDLKKAESILKDLAARDYTLAYAPLREIQDARKK